MPGFVVSPAAEMWDAALRPPPNPNFALLCLQSAGSPVLYPGISCSDVAVELPFTLMHPKPKEEPAHRDGECPALGVGQPRFGVAVGGGHRGVSPLPYPCQRGCRGARWRFSPPVEPVVTHSQGSKCWG